MTTVGVYSGEIPIQHPSLSPYWQLLSLLITAAELRL